MREFVFSCFSTKCVIKVASVNASDLADKCFNLCKNLHLKYNFFDANSLVSKINNRTEQKIKLDTQTYEILQKIKDLSKATNYIFDICKISLKTNKFSNDLIGENAFLLDKRRIFFNNIYTKIDLGGVIKEFAVDECAKICQNYPYVINFGGDIKTNTIINVNLKNPQNPTKALIKLELNNQALTTSGIYERKNHIIANNYSYNQASVIGENALNSGVFSTAFCISEIELPQDYKAVLINQNNTIFYKNFDFLSK